MNTLKNMFIIPVAYQTLVCGKLVALAIMTTLYCGYSALITILISAVLFPEGLSPISIILEAGKIIIFGLCLYIAIMPIMCWCCGRKNRFMAAAVLGFLYGFFGIPIAGHGLQDFYPITAGLTIIHYSGSNNAALSYHFGTAIVTLLLMVLLSYLILYFQSRTLK